MLTKPTVHNLLAGKHQIVDRLVPWLSHLSGKGVTENNTEHHLVIQFLFTTLCRRVFAAVEYVLPPLY
jgi:hypothetical protein